MRRAVLEPAAWLLSVIAVGLAPAQAADLIWQVENPFRFFKSAASFALHERAFAALRGEGAMPADIVWRIERRLNDPDCRDPSTPDSCAATRRRQYEQSRLGWAARTLGAICYESHARPRRYPVQCERRYSWGTAKEDYVLPEAHTVSITLAPQHLAGAGGECVWTWQPRRPGGRTETRRQPCKNPLTIARVPYAAARDGSGVAVSVQLPDGRSFADPAVVVEDLLLVALGDSFASGESNPDRPVTFSSGREMYYDPVNTREDDIALRQAEPKYGIASPAGEFDAKSLPKRLMEDEERERIYRPTSREFQTAFQQRAAQWVSADCHRSQYGYPFRVGLQLALENRQRAVTLLSLTCSGAEIAAGLFLEMEPRDAGAPGAAKVRAQLDQLADLLCRGGAAARTRGADYVLPVFSLGSTQISQRAVTKHWCAPEQRKRAIDLVLMSIGGNDVGFGAMAAYALTEQASDIAPIAGWVGHEVRFGPPVARAYLEVLDERMRALREALRQGFGVEPARVVQTSYEPIQFDETGALCGRDPTLGLDVHPKLRLSRERLGETADFLRDFLGRIECISDVRRRPACPSGLATGAGTGFTLVTEHMPAFAKRGVCARDPKRTAIDAALMAMPRKSRVSDAFKPYAPAHYLPYAGRWRLFRTPNDAFLTANTHRDGISPFDLLQPAYAGLYSGAIHPTAEAHAIVADHVMQKVRPLLDGRQVVQAAPR
jgi:hypothetical protein